MPRLTSFSEIAQGLSMVSFAGYGLGCLCSEKMVREFARFGLPRLRVLTGFLQMAASLGLAVGFFVPAFALVSALGLSAMMLGAIVVRLRVRDPLYAALPALGFLGLNAFIALSSFKVPGAGF